MLIEDRMAMWAAKRPRDEVAELLLEGAQEIADLRRHREEDGKQMSALISGYQKMQGLCIDGKYLTDEERGAIGYYIGTGGPDSTDATLRGLLERMRSGALTTCETVSQDGDCPGLDNAANRDNDGRLAALQRLSVLDEELGLPRRTPAAQPTPSQGSEQNGCTLTDEERAAISCLSYFGLRVNLPSGTTRKTTMTKTVPAWSPRLSDCWSGWHDRHPGRLP